jgi:tubulin polyglutamylase TTLL6/13
MKPYQRINHFAGSEELGRKDRLAVNLMKARAVMPDVFNYFPQTWLLPRDLSQFQKYCFGSIR